MVHEPEKELTAERSAAVYGHLKSIVKEVEAIHENSPQVNRYETDLVINDKLRTVAVRASMQLPPDVKKGETVGRLQENFERTGIIAVDVKWDEREEGNGHTAERLLMFVNPMGEIKLANFITEGVGTKDHGTNIRDLLNKENAQLASEINPSSVLLQIDDGFTKEEQDLAKQDRHRFGRIYR
ncbi:MAG: hypothetical protein WAP74_00675 [Patescibacteria group bacterium]